MKIEKKNIFSDMQKSQKNFYFLCTFPWEVPELGASLKQELNQERGRYSSQERIGR